jgi:O-antigen/teichoic acid export membrane protein
MTYIFGSLLTANGNLKQLNIIAAISVLINFSMNLILVPHLMALGSAIASFATLLFTAIAQVFLAQRIFRLKINIKFLITLSLFTGIVFMLNFISSQLPVQLQGFSEQSVQIGKLVAVALISSIIAFGMKMVSIRSMLTIIRRET